MKALVIHPDSIEVRDIEPRAAVLQEIVGGWLEGVAASISDDWCAYADEEGRLKQYPVNPQATHLARSLGWSGDFLVGTVVFLGQHHSGGEDGLVENDVPERLIEAVGR